MFNFTNRQNLDNKTHLYDVLGITKDATEIDVKKSYRKLAKQHHPDKGGDKTKFESISQAYDILSDSEKRQMYDQFGVTDEQAIPNTSGGLFDFLRPQRNPRTDNIIFKLKVTLNELYGGTTRKLMVTTNQVCTDCLGRGGIGSYTHCTFCRGSGKKINMQTLAPGMFQKTTTDCVNCKGKGRTSSNICIKCDGKGFSKHRKMIQVLIHKGMKHGQKLEYEGESDYAPDKKPGSVIVILQQTEHNLYRRENNDLFCSLHINIREALNGFKKKIILLDGRNIMINRSQPTDPGDLFTVKKYGMPILDQPFQTGDLNIKFIIDFPKSMTIAQKELIEQTFPFVSVSSSIDNVDDDILEVETVKKISNTEEKQQNNFNNPAEGCRTQ